MVDLWDRVSPPRLFRVVRPEDGLCGSTARARILSGVVHLCPLQRRGPIRYSLARPFLVQLLTHGMGTHGNDRLDDQWQRDGAEISCASQP